MISFGQENSLLYLTHMIDDVSRMKKETNLFLSTCTSTAVFFSSEYQFSFLFLFILSHCIEHLQANHQQQQQRTNNCPHLFKTLNDCTCVHSNTIDCSYSQTLTHLPRSWRSTNNNLTSFTQSITRFDLVHTPSITLIRTDDFHVNTLILLLLLLFDSFSYVGSVESANALYYQYRSQSNRSTCISSSSSSS